MLLYQMVMLSKQLSPSVKKAMYLSPFLPLFELQLNILFKRIFSECNNICTMSSLIDILNCSLCKNWQKYYYKQCRRKVAACIAATPAAHAPPRLPLVSWLSPYSLSMSVLKRSQHVKRQPNSERNRNQLL